MMPGRTVWCWAGWLLAAVIAVETPAQATSGGRAELEQSLAHRYGLTKIGSTLAGFKGDRSTIRQAGGIVVLQGSGLYGSVDPDQPASFAIRDGSPEIYRGRKDYAFPVGERLYVHSVFTGSDVVSLGLLTVRNVDTPAGSGRLWLALSFFFSAELLSRGETGAVWRVLDQWLLTEGQSPVQAQPPSAPQPSAAPAELKLGMTREQVVAALGPPLLEASFGHRTWLTYSAMIVLLEDDKLNSVDRSGQPPGKVTFASEPEGADIYLDGSFVSSSPATLPLPAGTYKVIIRLPGYQDWQQDLRVLAGSEVTLRPRLKKEASSAPR